MGEPQGDNPRPRRRLRIWLKRVGLGSLVVVVLAAIFHRPIVFEGTRYFVVRAARQQNLDIDYEMGGSIFSTLTVSNLRATPTEPGPIQRLEIGSIDLRYSLWGALRKGLPALLDLVQLQDVFIEITPSEEPPPEKQAEPQRFKFPALFPKTLQIENINFLSHGKDGDTVVEGLWFTLLPDKSGVLKVGILDIPGVRKWTEISARTTFRDRNLLLTELQIGPEIRLERFHLDASQLDEAELGIGLTGTLFDAPTLVDIDIRDLNATNELTAVVLIEGLEFARLGEYLNFEMPLSGRLDLAAVRLSGRPEEPETWSGNLGLRLAAVETGGHWVGDVECGVNFAEGRVQADVAASVGVALNVRSELPAKLDAFDEVSAEGVLALRLPDLRLLSADLPDPVDGDLSGEIRFRLQDGVFRMDGLIRSEALATGSVRIRGTNVTVAASKNLRVEEGLPVFEEAAGEITLTAAGAEVQDFAVDAVTAAVALDGAEVTLRNLSVVRGENDVKLTGAYTLPPDMTSFGTQPWKADVDVHAPALHEFLAADASSTLSGTLDVEGTAASDSGKIRGDFKIEGREFVLNGLEVPTVDGSLVVADNEARLDDFSLVFDDENFIHASGAARLEAPYAYHGALRANFANLSIFDPVSPEPLAGSLTAEWEGNGTSAKPQHSGRGKVVLTNGQYGALTALQADVEAAYTPEMLEMPVLRLSAEMGGIEAKVHWRNDTLTISDLAAQWKGLPVLTGAIAIPFHPAHLDNLDLLVPNDGAVNIALETPDLQLTDLFAQLGDDPPPASGAVRATLRAHGTIGELAADLALRATKIEVSAAEDVLPADATLDIALRDHRLAVNGRIAEPRINPLTITGAIPLNVAQVKREGSLPPDTPLDLRVTMANSPLGFVAGLVPIVRFIEGTAGIDLEMSGTVARPQFEGAVDADIRHLRLNNEGLPPITDVEVRIDSTTDRLTVSKFRGGIGGGVFGGEGTIDFSDPKNPVFDLAFGTRDALVMQDDALTLRISSRIMIDGPLEAATVGGQVFLTRSRFYKDIDILPIGLPGRPAPQPPEAPPVRGIPDPPLRNWKFDIAIKTADPFLVQGNLANGRVVVDLHLGGTGEDPWADGGVRIEQLRTSLPFSTLEIDNGLVYFTKDQPFLPQFDIRGTSQIRDYNITAYVFGDMTNPQTTFTSNPPLPQTEIVSLIATGVTSEELAGNPSVLAGKAATLLFQKIYRSVFHRRSSNPPRETLLSRIDFDLGATDSKTGRQGIGVRFPLSDNVVLSSGVDVGGDFRGQVKYLIRFR